MDGLLLKACSRSTNDIRLECGISSHAMHLNSGVKWGRLPSADWCIMGSLDCSHVHVSVCQSSFLITERSYRDLYFFSEADEGRSCNSDGRVVGELLG